MGKIKHKPTAGSQQHRLLLSMLQGNTVDPAFAFHKLNILIPSARCAELRRMGWPVRTIEMAHPNQADWPGESIVGYLLDAHFRGWYGDPENLGKHPGDYPFRDGRGKFEGWKTEDFERGETNDE